MLCRDVNEIGQFNDSSSMNGKGGFSFPIQCVSLFVNSEIRFISSLQVHLSLSFRV